MTAEYRWRGHDRDSIEVLRLGPGLARSEVSFGSWVWRYEVVFDEHWITSSATVGTLSIEHGVDGWTVDGTPRPDLVDAIDVDIVLTPFTNTLPLRREPLDVGQHADFVMA